jgi:hypothetical protein
MSETVYVQADHDVREIMESGFCDRCLRPASEWTEPNRMGHLEVHGAYDGRGNLVGFLCPECADQEG